MRDRKMKKLFLILGITALFAGAALAADSIDYSNLVPVEEISNDYTAPELKESVKPERVVINNREIEGYVTLEIKIDEKGVVHNAKVLYKTSNLAVYNAVEAVSKWKFTPATIDGQAVASVVAYNVPFGRDLDIFEEKSYEAKIYNGDTMFAMGK